MVEVFFQVWFCFDGIKFTLLGQIERITIAGDICSDWERVCSTK